MIDLSERLLVDPGPLTEMLQVIHNTTSCRQDRTVDFLYVKEHLQHLLLSFPDIGVGDGCVQDLLSMFSTDKPNPVSFVLYID